jgi:hypothetical protein
VIFVSGDVIVRGTRLVSGQFLWNELYKYVVCEHCLRSLETAEEMIDSYPPLSLSNPECCPATPEQYAVCPHCQVNIPHTLSKRVLGVR